METGEEVYKRLQRHLDRQAVGFPATKTGVEIRILKHIFTPLEAEIAICLTYRAESLETVFERAAKLVGSRQELAELLEETANKGGIETKIKDGTRFYCNTPLVIGMYEYQLGMLTPEFIKDFDEYTKNRKFGVEFLSTKLPQMRTIPIARSIEPRHDVSTFDIVRALLHHAEPPFSIFECICRKRKEMLGKFCNVTERKETCFAAADMAQAVLRTGVGREISLDEAISILEQNQKDGLVLQPSNAERAEFICSCCGCCCGILAVHKALPKPIDFWVSNFYAVVDTDACGGCGNCEKRCQVEAAKLSEKNGKCSIDLNRCIGCGLCVPTCPDKAIYLEKKKKEVRPPQTREDLYASIMSRKKTKLGKLGVTGKLMLDAIRTGQIHLLK